MFKLSALFAVLSGPALAAGLVIEVAGEQSKGTVTIDLFEQIAPQHVERLTTLASSGVYDDVVFHRVIEGFMAQTGDVEFGKAGGNISMAGRGGADLPDLPAEFSDTPFDRGVIGMARAQNPNSANSQFFIMFAEGYFLNGQYTVVGKVTDGMDVVDAIKLGKGANGAVLGIPDRMSKVTVTD
ncbi:MAG TPA: peptidylprolyl isomerase [Rhodobacteraceae bacterium]|nr:peptidylprolyl isomerase [Paracoccaceae bacterium]